MFEKDDTQFQDAHVLGLKARLTQAWLGNGTLVLIICIAKLQMLKVTLGAALHAAERGSIEMCHLYQKSADDILNLSRSSAMILNWVASLVLSKGHEAARSVLLFLLTVIQSLIIFMIEITIGTWACFSITLFHAVAEASLSLAEDTIKGINDVSKSIVQEADEGLQSLRNLVNKATGLIGSIEEFVSGSESQIGQVNLTLSKLSNFTIPDSVTTTIDRWKAQVPDYDDVQSDVKNIINIPFQKIRNEIGNITLSDVPSVQLANVSAARSVQVCSERNINEFYKRCVTDSSRAVDIICGLVAIALLSVMAYYCYCRRRQWRRTLDAVDEISTYDSLPEKVRATWALESVLNLEMTTVERFLVCRLRGGKHGAARSWFVQYLFGTVGLSLISLGLLGLVITLLEYVVFKVLQGVVNEAKDIVTALHNNVTALAMSEMTGWVKDINLRILQEQNNINSNVTGWVHQGSQSVNDTLSHFMTEVNNVIVKSLGNGTLGDLASGLVGCAIGRKVGMVEEGLTWVYNKSSVSLPLLPANITTTMNSTVSATNERAGGALTDYVDDVLDQLHGQIVFEAWVSGGFTLAWLVMATSALIYVIYISRPRARVSVIGR